MKITGTKLFGVHVVETEPFIDHRGSFARIFCSNELAPFLKGKPIAQANFSKIAKAGTIRGMHHQKPPHAEIKLVRCIRGSIWDVALDLRAGSPTFLQWHAEKLTSDNMKMLIIPEGCAHGVQALEHESEFIYMNTQFYAPDFEGCVRYNDPRAAIGWPLSADHLSEKDKNCPYLPADFQGIEVNG